MLHHKTNPAQIQSHITSSLFSSFVDLVDSVQEYSFIIYSSILLSIVLLIKIISTVIIYYLAAVLCFASVAPLLRGTADATKKRGSSMD